MYKKTTALILSLVFCIASQAQSIRPLSKAYQELLTQKHLWYSDCPVPLSRLREVAVNYYDFNDHLHTDGKLIVLDAVAPQTITIFKELEKRHFPINKIKLTSDYNGNDEASMEDNNTSAFNCRPTTNKPNEFSLHAYGVAIDINPLQNPYIGFSKTILGEAFILPKNATSYVNRMLHVPGSVEAVVDVFAHYGFSEWGGSWSDRIDYQHFQVPRDQAETLAKSGGYATLTASLSTA